MRIAGRFYTRANFENLFSDLWAAELPDRGESISLFLTHTHTFSSPLARTILKLTLSPTKIGSAPWRLMPDGNFSRASGGKSNGMHLRIRVSSPCSRRALFFLFSPLGAEREPRSFSLALFARARRISRKCSRVLSRSLCDPVSFHSFRFARGRRSPGVYTSA